ncbi:MAG: hypothetical protein QG554_2183 [Pseudomonadota bacterium]|nr:hypothetical protein [Pseudomonadota bacterium]
MNQAVEHQVTDAKNCAHARDDSLVLRTPVAVWDAIHGDHPMAPRHRLGETLVVHGLSEPSDIERALTLQRQGQPRPLGQILLSEGMVVEDDLKIALAAMAGMPVVDCLAVPPQDDAVLLVPQGTAERARVLPLLREGSTLVVAMEDPWHRPTLDELRFLSNLHIEAVMALPGPSRRPRPTPTRLCRAGCAPCMRTPTCTSWPQNWRSNSDRTTTTPPKRSSPSPAARSCAWSTP